MHPLFEKAEKTRQDSRFKAAQATYQTLLRRTLPSSEKAEALLGLADVERIQGHFPAAMRHYRSAANLFQRVHPSLVVDAQVGWALAARAMGKPRQALVELKKALLFYRRVKDLQGEAFVRWALGGTLRIAGGMKEGLKELLKSRSLYQKLGDREGKAYVCCALGGIYRMLGRYKESGQCYREANRRMRNRGDVFGMAYSYCGLGNVERMAGRFKAALPFYRKAERLYGMIGDRVSYAYTLWSLGTTHKMLGRYQEAKRDFNRADKLFQQTGDSRGRIYTLLGFAELKGLQKEFTQAIPYFKRAERIAKKYRFMWEEIHLRSLLQMFVQHMAEEATKYFSGAERKPYTNTVVALNKTVSSWYRTAGSSFLPKSLPINWP